ncbi:rRNA-processing protein utp23-like [Aristolochia californica]|uniref:rRNA-processing protein utp23-like n=1 Tax=Aristolochia californica TaxID=171875 RepID=UPI0035DE7352
MRVKKQKRHRKTVRFYTACFGFREPFKVLCDGTFIHHLLIHQLLPADQFLSNLLGGPTKLFASHCIVAELKSLGDTYSDALRAARELPMARCEHVGHRKSGSGCIQDIIGENNSEHFFLATQDVELRTELREIPGLPLIYGLRNALFLEPPSTSNRQYVKSNEEERLHVTELECKMLNKQSRRNLSVIQPAEEPSDVSEVLKQDKTKKALLGVADKVRFKRNKAKGPNPLSVKKKSRACPPVPQNQGGEAGEAVKKRNRKRKRSHKKSNAGESNS